MSESKSGELSPEPPKGTLNLASLFPEKTEVSTSIGPIYVRHIMQQDIDRFRENSLDGEELGKAFACQLISKNQDKGSCDPIEDVDFLELKKDDWRLLLPVIALRFGVRDFQGDAGFAALGDIVTLDLKERIERDKEAQEKIREHIASSYSFLAQEPLAKLQAQMSGLQGIRGALLGKDYLELSSRIGAVAAAAQFMGAENNKAAIEALKKGPLARMKSIELPKIRHAPPTPILRASETVLGKAALESASNTRETNAKMDSLVMVVGGLNQTLIESVLPAWFKEVESNQASAKQSFDQAAKSLAWTKWAVIVSVVVTGLTAWWQVSVTKSIDQANTEMQNSVEALLKEQLNVQKALIQQQSIEMEKLRILLNKPTSNIEKSK